MSAALSYARSAEVYASRHASRTNVYATSSHPNRFQDARLSF